jgi:hypothetical protein
MPHRTPPFSLLFALSVCALCVSGLWEVETARAQGAPPAPATTPSAATPLPIAAIPLAPAKEGGSSCESVAFSSDGALVALFTDQHALQLVRTADGATQRKLKTDEPCAALLFSPDGGLLIAGDAVISTVTGEVLTRLTTDFVYAQRFSADSSRFAIARRDSTPRSGADPLLTYSVEVWDLAEVKTHNKWPKAHVWALVTSVDLHAIELVFSRGGEALIMIENPSWEAGCGGGDEWIIARVFSASDGKEHTAWRRGFRDANGEDPNPAPSEAQDPTADPLAPDDPSSRENIRLISGFQEHLLQSAEGPDILYVSTGYEELRWDLGALVKGGFSAPPVASAYEGESLIMDYVPLQGEAGVYAQASYLGTHRLQTHAVFTKRAAADKAADKAADQVGAPEGSLLIVSPNKRTALWSVEKNEPLGCVPAILGEAERAQFSPRGDLLLLRHADRAYLWTTEALVSFGPQSCVKP